MDVWAVSFTEQSLTDDLYELGLGLIDPESQARVKRFYRRADACRCLLGLLLPRLLLKHHGVPSDALARASASALGRTAAGKPFVRLPRLEHTIGFSISHDGGYVVMGFQSATPNGHADAQVQRQDAAPHVDVKAIGADVMKIALPHDSTLRAFVESIAETLTARELRTLLASDVPVDEGVRRLFLTWTLKEAYTKALGVGLGFDFRRIEVDVRTNTVAVDGRAPDGWEFMVFQLGEDGEKDRYQVAIARFTGNEQPARVDVRDGVVHAGAHAPWFVHYDAPTLIKLTADEK